MKQQQINTPFSVDCMVRHARWWVREEWRLHGHEYPSTAEFARVHSGLIPRRFKHVDGTPVQMPAIDIEREWLGEEQA